MNLPFHDDRGKKFAQSEENSLYPIFVEAELDVQTPMVYPGK